MAGKYGTVALVDGDWELDANGQLTVLYDDDAVIQNVTSAIRLWFGEYEFNTNIGIKYRKYLGSFVARMTQEIQNDLTNAILSVTGVASVIEVKYNYDKDTNALQGTAYINLISGSTNVEVNF